MQLGQLQQDPTLKTFLADFVEPVQKKKALTFRVIMENIHLLIY